MSKGLLKCYNLTMRVYFQIGTNDGNDVFREIVQQEKPDLVVLVEPNIVHIDAIYRNYSNIQNVKVIHKCIYEKDDEEVTLYIPAENGVYGNRGKNGHTYDDGNYSLLPMNDWGDKSDMHQIKVPSIRFDTLCKELNITEIEYLQMDTEGYDSEIIKMIDLDAMPIRKIRYEKWYFDDACFTKYHKDIHSSLGKKGMDQVEEKLQKHGYVLSYISDRSGDDIIAIKQ